MIHMLVASQLRSLLRVLYDSLCKAFALVYSCLCLFYLCIDYCVQNICSFITRMCFVRLQYSRTLECEQLGLRVFYKTSKSFKGILT